MDNLKRLLNNYRKYELHCITLGSVPLSFRQWIYKKHNMPNLTFENLVVSLIKLAEIINNTKELEYLTINQKKETKND